MFLMFYSLFHMPLFEGTVTYEKLGKYWSYCKRLPCNNWFGHNWFATRVKMNLARHSQGGIK